MLLYHLNKRVHHCMLKEYARCHEVSILGLVSNLLSYSLLNLIWKGTGWHPRIFRVLPKDGQMFERRTVSGADVGKRFASCKTPREEQAAPTVITSAHLHSGVIRRAEQKQGQHIVLRTLLYPVMATRPTSRTLLRSLCQLPPFRRAEAQLVWARAALLTWRCWIVVDKVQGGRGSRRGKTKPRGFYDLTLLLKKRG